MNNFNKEELFLLLNKFKDKLSRKETFAHSIECLFELRRQVFETLLLFKHYCSREVFNAMPFKDEEWFHNKTIAYSIWHVFRIEDIIAHSLVLDDEQIFFSGSYQDKIKAPIITTGNELAGEQIKTFSEALDIDHLYEYAAEVRYNSDKIIRRLNHGELSRTVTEDRRRKLEKLKVVSSSSRANWLIDYWCSQDLKGLLLMPFSEHWLAHTVACSIISDGIKKNC